MKYSKGFTLLEILLVVAFVGLLAAIVIIAINPNRQLAQTRNTQRQIQVNALGKALEQYLVENQGDASGLPITNNYQEICAQDASDCTGFIDLTSQLVPQYLSSIPQDPLLSGSGSGYEVAFNPVNNNISVQALSSELGLDIAINPIPL